MPIAKRCSPSATIWACSPTTVRRADQVEALHRLLTLTPARLVGVSVADAIGDRRTINQPGTIDEYPNWRVPLTDGDGRPLLLEDIVTSDRARSLAGTIVNRRR